MTIKKVMKTGEGERQSEATMLPGRHMLEHAGASIPIRVCPNDEVVIYVNKFKGDPLDVWISGYESDAIWEMIGLESRTTEIKLKPKEGEDVLSLLGIAEGAETELVIEKSGPSMREFGR